MSNPKWLKNSIIYSVYPQSFNDTNGDGIGDLNGICEKLDYIKSLGANIIWMNPIFESPFKDAGYDVTDFYKIAPRYGTKEDLIKLCKEAKARDMHIALDLVAGHTSLECEWFQESCKYDKNQYSNRYIWTNSVSDLGDGTFINGYSERDGAYKKNYYYCQPALNYGYANPDPEKEWQLPTDHPDCIATQNEILKIMDYWIECGVDGFRVDMAFSLVKNDPACKETINVWKRLSSEFKKKHPECILIAEWGQPERSVEGGFDVDYLLQGKMRMYTTLFRYEPGKNDRMDYIGNSYFRKEGKGDFSEFTDEFIDQLEKIKGKGYMAIMTGSHDISRIAWDRDEDDLKVAQAFIMTMPAVPLVYYGDEIGMRYIEGMRSVEGAYIRTGSRTPMQWNDEKNHGFSTADKIYIPQDPKEDAPTVLKQEDDENSLLNHLRNMAKLRKMHPALSEDGDFKVIKTDYPAIYERSYGDEKITVVLNPSDRFYSVDVCCNEILAAKEAEISGDSLKIGGRGYFIFK